MPAVQYPDLSQMFGQYSMYPTIVGLDREAVAQQNNQINQATSLQDMLLKQQQEARLGKESEAKMALEKANADKLRQQLDQAAAAAKFKNTGEMAQALEQWGSIAEKNNGQIPLALQNQMPDSIREVFADPEGWKYAKAAGQIFRENSARWLGEEDKQKHQKELQELKGQIEKYKADSRAAALKYAADARQKVANIMANKPKAETALKTLDAAYIDAINRASNARDDNEKAFYTALAQEFVNQKTAYITATAAAKAAGTTDTGAVTGLQTRPAPNPRPVAPPNKEGASQYKKDDKGRIILD